MNINCYSRNFWDAESFRSFGVMGGALHPPASLCRYSLCLPVHLTPNPYYIHARARRGRSFVNDWLNTITMCTTINKSTYVCIGFETHPYRLSPCSPPQLFNIKPTDTLTEMHLNWVTATEMHPTYLHTERCGIVVNRLATIIAISAGHIAE